MRCEHFRARCDSGMRDASDSHLPVPDHFSQVSAVTERITLNPLMAPADNLLWSHQIIRVHCSFRQHEPPMQQTFIPDI